MSLAPCLQGGDTSEPPDQQGPALHRTPEDDGWRAGQAWVSTVSNEGLAGEEEAMYTHSC